MKRFLPFLMVFGLLRIIFWLATFPNPDEAYYWLWGQHPDFSYYDHPPLQAWVQGLFTKVLGRSNVSLRSPNVISNAIFFYTYYQICIYLYGDNPQNRPFTHYFGFIILCILASPLYFLFLALAWQDHLLITATLVSLYWLIRFLDGYAIDGKGESWHLYGAAVAIGLAGLCKYNVLFVVLGMAATIISDRRWRSLLRDRRLYVAIAIILCLLSPILIWNLRNDFQSFHYYFSRSVDARNPAIQKNFQIKWKDLLVFGLVSILTVSPFNVWAMVQAIAQPTHPIKPNSAYRPLALWIFAISTVSLTAIALVSTALYYWNILAYLLLFPLLPPVFLGNTPATCPPDSRTLKASESSKSPKNGGFRGPSKFPRIGGFRGRIFIASQCYGLLFATLLVVHYSLLPLSALVSLEGDPDSRMLFGWPEVAAAVQVEATTLGDRAFLVTTDYRSASALAYQLNRQDAIAVSDRRDQFDFWYEPNQLRGRNAVILADDWHPIQPALRSQFTHTSEAVTIPVLRFGILIKKYYVVRGYGFFGH